VASAASKKTVSLSKIRSKNATLDCTITIRCLNLNDGERFYNLALDCN